MKDLKECFSDGTGDKNIQSSQSNDDEVIQGKNSFPFEISSDSDAGEEYFVEEFGSKLALITKPSNDKYITKDSLPKLDAGALPSEEEKKFSTKEVDTTPNRQNRENETQNAIGNISSLSNALTTPPENQDNGAKSTSLSQSKGKPDLESRGSNDYDIDASNDMRDLMTKSLTPLNNQSNDQTLSKDNSIEPSNSIKTSGKKPIDGVPLAECARPIHLEDFIGQDSIMRKGGMLRKLIEQDKCPSMILWGPSGVGKTTLARLIAQKTQSRFIEISATAQNKENCHRVLYEARREKRINGVQTLLFLDEIHSFSAAQQDIFLPAVENGDIILIGATTQNPSLKVVDALTSRCKVFKLGALTDQEILIMLQRALNVFNGKRQQQNLKEIRFEEGSLEYFLDFSNGDGRYMISILEMMIKHFLYLESKNNLEEGTDNVDKPYYTINLDTTRDILGLLCVRKKNSNSSEFLSALRNSIRGSNADASLYYLYSLIRLELDPTEIADQFIRIAAEDIGFADESCLSFASNTRKTVDILGMPDAEVTLAHCCIKLARAPKSSSVYKIKENVKIFLIEHHGALSAPIPIHLRNAPNQLMKNQGHGKGYKYNPDYVDGRVNQKYMPNSLEKFTFIDKAE